MRKLKENIEQLLASIGAFYWSMRHCKSVTTNFWDFHPAQHLGSQSSVTAEQFMQLNATHTKLKYRHKKSVNLSRN